MCSYYITQKTKGNIKLVLFVFLVHIFMFRSIPTLQKMTEKIISVDFEVFGKVQQVFFRKCTQDEAIRLGVKGWCKNTPQGTVQGTAEGLEDKITAMKKWLQTTGSPQSVIERAEFKNERQIDRYTYDDFSIMRRQK